jgi:hypothetical protein
MSIVRCDWAAAIRARRLVSFVKRIFDCLDLSNLRVPVKSKFLLNKPLAR